MTGFREGEDDKITIKPDRDRRHSDDMGVKDLGPGLYLDGLFEMVPDMVPAFLKRCAPQDHLVGQ